MSYDKNTQGKPNTQGAGERDKQKNPTTPQKTKGTEFKDPKIQTPNKDKDRK